MENAEFPHTLCPDTCTSFPMTHITPQTDTCVTMNLHLHTIISQSPFFTLWFTLGAAHSLGFFKNFIYLLASPHGVQDPSSLTRDRT